VKHCKKCSAGEVRVRIMSNGFCEECEYDRAWNNKAEEKRQRDMILRMQMRKRASDEVNRKWKEKYGDASPEEVASYR
jgi:C4-type Zn-finger protein